MKLFNKLENVQWTYLGDQLQCFTQHCSFRWSDKSIELLQDIFTFHKTNSNCKLQIMYHARIS